MNAPPATLQIDEQTVVVRGTVKKITHFDAETLFHIVSVKLPKIQRHLHITGTATAQLAINDQIEAHGVHIEHPKYGPQLQAQLIMASPGETLADIVKYLGKSDLPGMTPDIAKALKARFGKQLIEIIAEQPVQMAGVGGLTLDQAVAITTAWNEKRASARTMIFLLGIGLTPRQSLATIAEYGADAEPNIRKNPYRLAKDISGVGFTQADKIASSFGVAQDSPSRIVAGFRHILDVETSEGHCAVPEATTIRETSKLLNIPQPTVASQIIAAVRYGAIASWTIAGIRHLAPMSATIPTIRLEKNRRQGTQSAILANAWRILAGEVPELDTPYDPTRDYYFIPANDPRQIIDNLIHVIRDRIPARLGLDPIRDIQTLCPSNKSPIGTLALNTELRHALLHLNTDPSDDGQPQFSVRDKVIYTENRRGLSNGEIGFVTAIESDPDTIVVNFGRQELIRLAGKQAKALKLAYAITIHKSQGSEYQVVVLVVSNLNAFMWNRNLIFTAFTRARRFLVVIGDPNALRDAVRKKAPPRITNLEWLLRRYVDQRRRAA